MRFQGNTPDEKLDKLEAFIEFWAGPRQPEFGAAKGDLDHLNIPSSLRRFYEFCFNWPGRGRGLGRGIGLFSTQNHLVRLSSTDEASRTIHQDLIVIAHEDQGVTHWAIP